MKALVIFLLPAMMLIGCGQMDTNTDSTQNVLSSLNVSEEQISGIDESYLNAPVELTNTGGNSFMLKLEGTELLVDLIENLNGDQPEEVAMIINGVEVVQSIASDSKSLQALIASLVASQVENINISGLPASELVQAGLNLIKGDLSQANFANVFENILSGFLGNFLNGSSVDGILGQITDAVKPPGDQNTSNNANSGDNKPDNGGLLGTIGDVIGGGQLGNGSSLFGGLFGLLSDLFKK